MTGTPPTLLAVVLPEPPDTPAARALYARARDSSSCRVLWFADTDSEPWRVSVAKDAAMEMVPVAGRLQRVLDRFGREMREFVHALLRAGGWPPDAWLTRLTEINFADPAWFSILRARLVVDEVERTGSRRLLVIGEPDLVAMLKGFAARRGIEFAAIAQGTSISRLRLSVSAWGAWALNLRAELLWRRRLRTLAARPPRGGPFLVTDFPNNWRSIQGAETNRFAGADLSRSAIKVLTASRRFRRRLASPSESEAVLARLKAIARAFAVEPHGTTRDILNAYFDIAAVRRWRQAARRAQKAGAFFWHGLDLEPALRRLLIDAPVVDLPKNRHLRRSVARALAPYPRAAATVPVFELSEGRALLAGAREAGMLTIGLQHGALGPAHLWRFAWPVALRRNGAAAEKEGPDFWCVESPLVAESLREMGIAENAIGTIGAVREDQSPPCFDTKDCRETILVLGEMHAPRHFLRQAMAALAGSGHDLVIRPHPATAEALHEWLAEEARRFGTAIALSEASRRIEDELDVWKPRLIVLGTSGAGISLARQGWPVVVLLSNWLPNNNPLLLGEGGEEAVFAAAGPDELRQWIHAIAVKPDRLRAYSNICRRAGERLLVATGTEAQAGLDRVLNGAQKR